AGPAARSGAGRKRCYTAVVWCGGERARARPSAPAPQDALPGTLLGAGGSGGGGGRGSSERVCVPAAPPEGCSRSQTRWSPCIATRVDSARRRPARRLAARCLAAPSRAWLAAEQPGLCPHAPSGAVLQERRRAQPPTDGTGSRSQSPHRPHGTPAACGGLKPFMVTILAHGVVTASDSACAR